MGLARRSSLWRCPGEGGKAEDVGRVVLTPIGAVQVADALVADQGDAHDAVRARRRHAPQPRAEPGGARRTALRITDLYAQTPVLDSSALRAANDGGLFTVGHIDHARRSSLCAGSDSSRLQSRRRLLTGA